MQGYILLWRKFLETSFYYKDSQTVHLALHLLLKANYMDKKIVFNGEELVIKRGQHLTGRNVLSKETGINPYSVRRRLILLSKLDFLHIKVNNKFSIITICNYDDYQLPNDVTAQQDAQQLHNNCTTTAHT